MPVQVCHHSAHRQHTLEVTGKKEVPLGYSELESLMTEVRSDLERWRGTRKALWMGKGNVCLEIGGDDGDPCSLDTGSNLLLSGRSYSCL